MLRAEHPSRSSRAAGLTALQTFLIQNLQRHSFQLTSPTDPTMVAAYIESHPGSPPSVTRGTAPPQGGIPSISSSMILFRNSKQHCTASSLVANVFEAENVFLDISSPLSST